MEGSNIKSSLSDPCDPIKSIGKVECDDLLIVSLVIVIIFTGTLDIYQEDPRHLSHYLECDCFHNHLDNLEARRWEHGDGSMEMGDTVTSGSSGSGRGEDGEEVGL